MRFDWRDLPDEDMKVKLLPLKGKNVIPATTIRGLLLKDAKLAKRILEETGPVYCINKPDSVLDSVGDLIVEWDAKWQSFLDQHLETEYWINEVRDIPPYVHYLDNFVPMSNDNVYHRVMRMRERGIRKTSFSILWSDRAIILKSRTRSRYIYSVDVSSKKSLRAPLTRAYYAPTGESEDESLEEARWRSTKLFMIFNALPEFFKH